VARGVANCANSVSSSHFGTISDLPRLRTPPNRHLQPSDPLSASLGQVLTLGNQTLMNRTGQHRDAVPADLVAEVLAVDANGTRAGRTQDIHIQVVPILRWQHRASRGHREKISALVLSVLSLGVKCCCCQTRAALAHDQSRSDPGGAPKAFRDVG